jgi:hypothetical protein
MVNFINSKSKQLLAQELQRLQSENNQLKNDNHCLEMNSCKQISFRLPRTGWSDIDDLFEKAEGLHHELRTIKSSVMTF